LSSGIPHDAHNSDNCAHLIQDVSYFILWPTIAGLSYLDKSKDPANPEKKVEDRESFGFDGYVDSVFLGAPEHMELDVGTGAAVAIDATGWEDAVVWNPYHTMKECFEVCVCMCTCLLAVMIMHFSGENASPRCVLQLARPQLTYHAVQK
jgi:hypothetical protein